MYRDCCYREALKLSLPANKRRTRNAKKDVEFAGLCRCDSSMVICEDKQRKINEAGSVLLL